MNTAAVGMVEHRGVATWTRRCAVGFCRRHVAVKALSSVEEKVMKETLGEMKENGQIQARDVKRGGGEGGRGGKGRVVVETEEELKSSWEHRAWVWGASGLMAMSFGMGVVHADSMAEYAWIVAGAVGAYLLADLGTGIYHWGVDNYGDGSTPVFGGQIAAFQGHHKRPWTITEREFCNNVHKVFAPAAPVAAVLCLGSYLYPGTWSVWSSTFLFLACMSQQFHAWSHMKRSELPSAIVMAQDAGVLISRKDHGAHHKAPFDGYYCIVSGIWNPILDKNGADDSFFRNLERFIYDTWGVEPRCWYEPDETWSEEVRA